MNVDLVYVNGSEPGTGGGMGLARSGNIYAGFTQSFLFIKNCGKESYDVPILAL
jgi:hypothetical protein